MKDLKLTRNPFLLFAPFLLLYIVVIIISRPAEMFGDESRYLIYAHYMISGFIPPSEINFDTLGNGPGYSIILIPFVALHIPILWMALMNAFFYYFSIILLYKVLIQIASYRAALIASLFWACYFNVYETISFTLPETFTVFLICLIIFCLINAFNTRNSNKINWHIYISGFAIGYLALTKPIFGYVLIFMLTGIVVLWLINKRSTTHKRSLLILLVALCTTLPYLVYTYQLTGKIFYWSSFGGNNLYWMSTPYEREYGNWHAYQYSPNAMENIAGSEETIRIHHQQAFEVFEKYQGVEQDDMLKKLAINNIKSHPIKYIQNCISNVGRIIFNFPYSYKIQRARTLLRLPANGIILVLAFFCLIPTLKNWGKIIFPIRFLLFFSLLYFGGSILGSADIRMFTIIVPILLIWITFIIQKSAKINLSW